MSTNDIKIIREALMGGSHVARLNALPALDRMEAQQADIAKLIEAGDGMAARLMARDAGWDAVDAWDAAKSAAPAQQQPKRLTEQWVDACIGALERALHPVAQHGATTDTEDVRHAIATMKTARDHGYIGGLSMEDVREVLRDWYKGLSEPQEAEFIDRLTAKLNNR